MNLPWYIDSFQVRGNTVYLIKDCNDDMVVNDPNLSKDQAEFIVKSVNRDEV